MAEPILDAKQELQLALDNIQGDMEFLQRSQADVAAQYDMMYQRLKSLEDWSGKTTKTLDFILDRVRQLHPYPEKVTCSCGNFSGTTGAKCPLCGETIA